MQGKITRQLIESLKTSERPYEVWDVELRGFLLKVRPTGVWSYFFAYRRTDGRRTRFKIGETSELSPSEARQEAKRVAADVTRGQDPMLDKQRAVSGTLKAFLENQYEPWILERRTGAATINRIRRCFDSFMAKPLNEIHTWHLEKWRSDRIKAGIQATTVNRDIATLRTLLARAVAWKIIDRHPFADLKPKRVDKKGIVRFLSECETKRLKEALAARDQDLKDSRDRGNLWRLERGYREYSSLQEYRFADYVHPLVLTALNTGLRRGELFQLKWSNVDLDRRMLTVIGVTAKSGSTRHVPLNSEALDALSAWGQQRDSSGSYVFPGEDGDPLTDCKRSWATILKRALIEDFRFHDMRHDFASKLVMRGVDLNTVRELLGHSDLSMTLRYAHLAPAVKAAAVEKLIAPTHPLELDDRRILEKMFVS